MLYMENATLYTLDLESATRIAEDHVAQFSTAALPIVLFSHKTIELEFGWVFFAGRSDAHKFPTTTILTSIQNLTFHLA